MSLQNIKKELRAHGTKKKAMASAWFFKTGPGQYGEGDVFIGVTVPEQRKIALRYGDISLPEVEKLLHSPEHEFRLTALIILVNKWKTASALERKKIHQLYIRNTKWINNWDLVDTSAGYIVGEYFLEKDRSLLTRLAHSKSLWERRIAMIATFAYIRKGESKDAFMIADILLHDEHDLMHKAVGWMLREVGKCCGESVLEKFLKTRYKKMPRTMTRYAIERFPEKKRKAYLAGTI